MLFIANNTFFLFSMYFADFCLRFCGFSSYFFYTFNLKLFDQFKEHNPWVLSHDTIHMLFIANNTFFFSQKKRNAYYTNFAFDFVDFLAISFILSV